MAPITRYTGSRTSTSFDQYFVFPKKYEKDVSIFVGLFGMKKILRNIIGAGEGYHDT